MKKQVWLGRKNDMKRRLRNGETYKSIGETYGVSRQRIQQICKQFGIIPVMDKTEKKFTRLFKEHPEFAHKSYWEAVAKELGGWSIGMQPFCDYSNLSKYKLNELFVHLGIKDKVKRPYGENHHQWKGGEYIDAHGYVRVRVNGKSPWKDEWYALHPEWKWSSITLHQFILEVELLGGIPLHKSFHIHHCDENKTNNRTSNLAILPRGVHFRLHLRFQQGRITRDEFIEYGQKLGTYYFNKIKKLGYCPNYLFTEEMIRMKNTINSRRRYNRQKEKAA